MGLLSIIKKIKRKERQIRILILGLDGAGKSTVVAKLLDEDTAQVTPTFGFQIKTFEFRNFLLNLWDIGGQATIRAYWRNYYEETDGVIWVVDSVDLYRLDEVQRELESVLHEERLQGASLLILANKQDIKGSANSQTLREALHLDHSLKGHNWRIMECSGITGRNIKESFEWLVNEIEDRLFYLK